MHPTFAAVRVLYCHHACCHMKKVARLTLCSKKAKAI